MVFIKTCYESSGIEYCARVKTGPKELHDLVDKISPYRAGYFGKEREGIEKKLSDGTLRGVISTNALELGINIGGLDACIIDKYPGTIMNTRQQAGRAGRGDKESVVVLVAGLNALDQYYMRYPEEFFGTSSEEAVLNVSNPYIQAGHILCAANEMPLTEEDEKYFGSGSTRTIEMLEAEGLLTGDESKSTVNPNPHMQVSIRGISQDTYSIFTFSGGQRIPIEKGIEKAMAFKEAFEGAIYLHMGTPYQVIKLDHDKKEIHAEETKAEYYTKASFTSDISIKEKYTEKPLPSCRDAKVGLGDVEVVEQVTEYKKYKYFRDTVLETCLLEMPKLSLETVALWIELPDRFTNLVEEHNLDFAGGIHAIEHAMIAMYPLRLLADRNDVGGIATPNHNDLNGKSGVFVYDGHRGGVGYAERGYEIITDILEVTLKAVEGCPCHDGCPSCIQSPKCGNHNEPLDKHAAIMILHELLGKPSYAPPKSRKSSAPPPAPAQEESDKPVDIGAALDRVWKRLRRDAMKPENPTVREGSQKYGKREDASSFSVKKDDDSIKVIQKHSPQAYESLAKEDVLLKTPAEEVQVAHKDVGGDFDRDLFEILVNLRKKIAEEKNVPSTIIFHDSILMAMAAQFPRDLPSFRNINGVREIKVEKYGESFLKEIVNYCKKHEYTPPLSIEEETHSEKSKAYSVEEIQKTYPRAYEPWTEEEDEQLLSEYQSGKTIKELMGIFGRQRGGIESRLKKLGLL